MSHFNKKLTNLGFSNGVYNFYKPLSIKCLQGFFVYYYNLKIEVLIDFYFINNRYLGALPPLIFQDARLLGPSRGV